VTSLLGTGKTITFFQSVVVSNNENNSVFKSREETTSKLLTIIPQFIYYMMQCDPFPFLSSVTFWEEDKIPTWE
jgi:hypothetical protein